jgi:Colicin V production protein
VEKEAEMLGFFTIVIMLIAAYAFWREGALPAFAMAINILLAGLIAFNFFEPIAGELDSLLAESFLHGYEDSLCLVVLFSLSLAFLRWAANALIHTNIEYDAFVQQIGAALFGAVAGYLVAGFLLCVAQTLPLDRHFLHFDAQATPSGSGAKVRRVLPPDRVWLALMHRASAESLGWDETPFDADGSFEMRYALERRISE